MIAFVVENSGKSKCFSFDGRLLIGMSGVSKMIVLNCAWDYFEKQKIYFQKKNCN